MHALPLTEPGGQTFSNYSTYFFEQAGLTETIPYDFALGQYGLNTIGAFVVWTFMAYGIVRRTLFLCGLTGLFVTLLTLGFVGLLPESQNTRHLLLSMPL